MGQSPLLRMRPIWGRLQITLVFILIQIGIKEIGPLTMSGLTPSGPESLNLDSIDNISVSLSPFPSNNIGKIYSFQVIAYSNFG